MPALSGHAGGHDTNLRRYAAEGMPRFSRRPTTGWRSCQPSGVAELNLLREGISTVIWATGYALDYGWIDAPILDERGYPRNVRGVTGVPGPSFLGLLWQHSQASASLVGPELDELADAETAMDEPGDLIPGALRSCDGHVPSLPPRARNNARPAPPQNRHRADQARALACGSSRVIVTRASSVADAAPR